MSYHKDPECNEALIKLLDALCEWERGTGRRSTLILIPHEPDESVVVAEDGKPMAESEVANLDAHYVWAVAERKGRKVK